MNHYKVLHVARSGGHVFLNWIMFHYDKAVHSNCVKHPDPGSFKITRFWMPDLMDKRIDGTVRLVKGEAVDPRISNDRACLKRHSFPCWVMSVEDCRNPGAEGMWDLDWGPKPEHSQQVYLIRSYLNTMASRVKDDSKRPSRPPRKGPCLWKEHARAAFESGCYVWFDLFIESADYRREVEEMLGLPRMPERDEQSLGVVAPDAGGSSFNGTRLDEVRAGVHRRYEEVELPDGWADDQEAFRLEDLIRREQ